MRETLGDYSLLISSGSKALVRNSDFSGLGQSIV
jgi:hypothetical protein